MVYTVDLLLYIHDIISQTLNVWHIYLHLVNFHVTLSVWDMFV